MRQRSSAKTRLGLEHLEPKTLLSAATSTTHIMNSLGASPALAHTRDLAGAPTGGGHVAKSDAAPIELNMRRKPAPPGAYGFLAFRVTNPSSQIPYKLIPPFEQVLVQSAQPVPGQVYNVTSVAVRNGTAQTFTASNGFTVRTTNQPKSFAGFPILTGSEEWKPGQVIVFYVLTKKYYAVSFVAGGFQFNLGGRSSTAIPGPSGIFLRLTYDPATFARTLNWIVAYGQGNQLGQGARFGLPNTSINEIVDARTQRTDFAGHF